MDFIMWKMFYTELLSVVVLLVLVIAGVCALVQGARGSQGGCLANAASVCRNARGKIISAGSSAAAVVGFSARAREDEDLMPSKLSPAAFIARIAAVILALVLAFSFITVGAPAAFAAQFGTSASANEASQVTEASSVQFRWGNDVLWAGKEWKFSGAHSDNDILAAGQRIDLENVTAQGSVRAAGQDVHLSNVFLEQSATIAGQHVSVEGGSAKSVALAGADVVFSGMADELHIAATSVSINGVIHGDVHVDAETLTLGDAAVVEGTLYASVANEPLVAPDAQVAKMDVALTNARISPLDGAGIVLTLVGGRAVLSILGVFLMTLLMEVLLRQQTVKSAAMVKVRTAPLLISGAVGSLVAPVAIVVLLFTLIGIPFALALVFMLVGLQIVATGFAAASLAKVAFPHWGRFKAAMLMGLLVGIIDAIPFVGMLVPFAAFVYSLGYVVQKVYLGMRLEPPAAPGFGPGAPGAPGGSDMSGTPGAPGAAGVPPVAGVSPVAGSSPVPPASPASDACGPATTLMQVEQHAQGTVYEAR